MSYSCILYLHTETFENIERPQNQGAWMVSEDGDEDEAFWLPKSQCEETDRIEEVSDDGEPGCIALEVPTWLADKHGLS